jgi:hypothetical protein
MNEEEVNEVLARHRRRLLDIEGIHGFGVGRASDYGLHGDACIVVHGSSAARAAIPGTLDGVPVQFIEAGPFELEEV